MTSQENSSAAAPHAVAPASIFAQAWARKGRFAVVFAATLATAVAAMLLITPVYFAAGSIILGEHEPINSNTSPAWINKLGDPADLESQLLVVQSPRLIRRALASPGVFDAVVEECRTSRPLKVLHGTFARNATCDKLKPDNEHAVDYAQSRYSVRAVGRSRVISVGYQSTSPKVAETMANALTRVYLEDQLTARAKGREATAGWLWKEVERLGSELAGLDGEIQAERRKHNLVRGATAVISSEQLTAIGQQLALAEAAEAEAASRVMEMRRGEARASIESQVVARIKQEHAVAVARLQSASAVLKDRHPALQALVRQKESLEASLRSELSRLSSGAKLAHAAARAKVDSLQGQLSVLKRNAEQAADSEAALSRLVREADSKRAIYNDLSRKAGEMEAEQRALVGSARLVSYAEMPTLPVFPRKTPILAAGLTLALLLGFAATRIGRA